MTDISKKKMIRSLPKLQGDIFKLLVIFDQQQKNTKYWNKTVKIRKSIHFTGFLLNKWQKQILDDLFGVNQPIEYLLSQPLFHSYNDPLFIYRADYPTLPADCLGYYLSTKKYL